MNENEWLAMRGLVDILCAILIFTRFFWYSAQLQNARARFVQLSLLTILIIALQWLGVWSWREIAAALKLLPVYWPLLAIIIYLAVRSARLNRRLERAEFENDWRRAYQEVLIEELQQQGSTAPPPPSAEQ